jgi:hypothetical protein
LNANSVKGLLHFNADCFIQLSIFSSLIGIMFKKVYIILVYPQ